MNWAGALAIGSAVIGAYSAIESANASSDAAAAQQQAVALQRRQQEIASARQRRQALREYRIAQAQNQARGVAQGMTGSSAMSGIQGALNTSIASNLNYLDVTSSLNAQRGSFLDAANASQARSGTFGALSGLGFNVAGTSFDIFRSSNTGRQWIANL
jgi:hypothetical protein